MLLILVHCHLFSHLSHIFLYYLFHVLKLFSKRSPLTVSYNMAHISTWLLDPQMFFLEFSLRDSSNLHPQGSFPLFWWLNHFEVHSLFPVSLMPYVSCTTSFIPHTGPTALLTTSSHWTTLDLFFHLQSQITSCFLLTLTSQIYKEQNLTHFQPHPPSTSKTSYTGSTGASQPPISQNLLQKIYYWSLRSPLSTFLAASLCFTFIPSPWTSAQSDEIVLNYKLGLCFYHNTRHSEILLGFPIAL